MKKKFLILTLLCCFLVTGCFGKKSDALSEIEKKYDNLKAYSLSGDLEIVNNDDTYNYDVKVIFQKKDKFYVSLKNRSNNHEQIILKNEDGVYVITPSLNKSFKFQSDWPYNNSQVYLIESIINDIKNDKERSLITSDSNYVFTTAVNYPNNRKLVKQVVTFDKDYNLKSVSVENENDISSMKMTFQTINLKPEISDSQFDLNKIMGTINNNSNDNTTNDEKENTTEEKTTEDEPTSKLEDIIYPLYLPTGTVLANSEKINKADGERIIMTFEGEKPFLLVEETASVEEEFSIIPTYGEPYLLIDTVGALTDSSITWSSNGVEYYLVSDVLSQDEMLDIARSVNVIPVMK